MSLRLGSKGENEVAPGQWLQNITGQQMLPQQETVDLSYFRQQIKEYHICGGIDKFSVFSVYIIKEGKRFGE